MITAMEAVGPLQLRVLHHLWQHGSSSVHAVHRGLSAVQPAKSLKPIAYTTVLTVMRNLVRRSLLAQIKEGRAHHFQILVRREDYQRPLLGFIRKKRV
jgi:predicted transcriptional regulator